MNGEEQDQVLRDTLVAIRDCRKEVACLKARIRVAQEAYVAAHHLMEYPAEVDRVIDALPSSADAKRWVHELAAAEKKLAELERLERAM